jgi:hypothetical protein
VAAGLLGGIAAAAVIAIFGIRRLRHR